MPTTINSLIVRQRRNMVSKLEDMDYILNRRLGILQSGMRVNRA
jgi:hypothetical protein